MNEPIAETWSCRLRPTGRFTNGLIYKKHQKIFNEARQLFTKMSLFVITMFQVTPTSSKWSCGPIPDNMSNCGELIAPALIMISLVAIACFGIPWCK